MSLEAFLQDVQAAKGNFARRVPFILRKKTLRVFHLSNKPLHFMPASDAFEKNVGFLSQTHNGTNCIFTSMETIKIDHSRR